MAYRPPAPLANYARFWDAKTAAVPETAWGLLTAMDFSTGDIAWHVPLGPHGTGAPNIGGSIATAGEYLFLLPLPTTATFVHSMPARAANSGPQQSTQAAMRLRLPTSGKDNKQFVVIAAGGGGFFGSPPGDSLIAFKLPE